MQCKSLWIKASAKCVNVNVNVNYRISIVFKETSKSNMTISNNSFNTGHCMSMKLNTGNMHRVQHVNIPTHPILDESDMYVHHYVTSNQASLLTSILWTACCFKLNNQSSGCCYNQSEFFLRSSFSWSIIAVTAEYSLQRRPAFHCLKSLWNQNGQFFYLWDVNMYYEWFICVLSL